EIKEKREIGLHRDSIFSLPSLKYPSTSSTNSFSVALDYSDLPDFSFPNLCYTEV
ncbi:hypothetical protein L9F63_014148, partial [Diploptera punctata]